MKILGFNYRVGHKLRDPEAHLGECYAHNLEINIAGNVPVGRQSEVLMHEIFEAINDHCNLKLNHTQLSTASVVLHKVMLDNGVDLKPLMREVR